MRPKKDCKIGFMPEIEYFKPFDTDKHGRGDGLTQIEIIEVTCEEIEALRLKNLKAFDQTKAAKQMGISQSTFQRILTSAYKKTSDALVNGKAIKIVSKQIS